MAVVITKQPENIQVMEGKISAKLSVEATGATGYQWKQAKSSSSTAGATNVAGQTTKNLTVPVGLTEGYYYYFCEVTDGASPVNSNIASVQVVDFPEYITGRFVNEYVAACATTVQERFAQAKKLSGIDIPNDNKVLRTAQVELFMSIL